MFSSWKHFLKQLFIIFSPLSFLICIRYHYPMFATLLIVNMNWTKTLRNNILGLPTEFYCYLILHFIKCYWQYSFIACYPRLKSQAWCPLHLVNVINWCIWFVISGCTIIKFAIDNNIKFNSNRSSFSRFVITWHTNSCRFCFSSHLKSTYQDLSENNATFMPWRCEVLCKTPNSIYALIL